MLSPRSHRERERQRQRQRGSVSSLPAIDSSLYPTPGPSTSPTLSATPQKGLTSTQSHFYPSPRAPHFSLLHRNTHSTSSVPTMNSLVIVNSNDVLNLAVDPRATGLGSRTTRLFSAMRRSNSYSHRRLNTSDRGMFSTPEERSVSPSPITSRRSSPGRTTSQEPPSIAQIAMGLHVSRTPHIGPTHAHLLGSEPSSAHSRYIRPVVSPPRSTSPHETQTASSSTRVATPLRSSLKKTDPLNKSGILDSNSRSASPSISTSSSVTSLPRYALSRLFAASGTGRSRLDKFLRRNGNGRPPVGTGTVSLNSSDSDISSQRKAVRFMAIVEETDSGRRH